MHNELKHEKKIPISNVCLGGCTITLKTKINVFRKNFFTPGPLQRLSTWTSFKKLWFLAFECCLPAKMDFFLRFSSLCIAFKKVTANIHTSYTYDVLSINFEFTRVLWKFLTFLLKYTYLQGMLGWDDQSQMISEAESPFSSAATLTSGLFKWFMYTALSSSSKDEANSGFGVFGGDLGL